MITEPKIETRNAQPYVGIRTQVLMRQLPEVIPQLIDETATWLGKHGGQPAGPPFIRYHVIDMEAELDIEVGWPVAEPLSGDDRASAGVIPAVRYGTLIYTDVTRGIEGNRALIEWARENGLVWDAWDAANGHVFNSRLEYFLDGPADDPDPTHWRTEVAILLADE